MDRIPGDIKDIGKRTTGVIPESLLPGGKVEVRTDVPEDVVVSEKARLMKTLLEHRGREGISRLEEKPSRQEERRTSEGEKTKEHRDRTEKRRSLTPKTKRRSLSIDQTVHDIKENYRLSRTDPVVHTIRDTYATWTRTLPVHRRVFHMIPRASAFIFDGPNKLLIFTNAAASGSLEIRKEGETDKKRLPSWIYEVGRAVVPRQNEDGTVTLVDTWRKGNPGLRKTEAVYPLVQQLEIPQEVEQLNVQDLWALMLSAVASEYQRTDVLHHERHGVRAAVLYGEPGKKGKGERKLLVTQEIPFDIASDSQKTMEFLREEGNMIELPASAVDDFIELGHKGNLRMGDELGKSDVRRLTEPQRKALQSIDVCLSVRTDGEYTEFSQATGGVLARQQIEMVFHEQEKNKQTYTIDFTVHYSHPYVDGKDALPAFRRTKKNFIDKVNEVLPGKHDEIRELRSMPEKVGNDIRMLEVFSREEWTALYQDIQQIRNFLMQHATEFNLNEKALLAQMSPSRFIADLIDEYFGIEVSHFLDAESGTGAVAPTPSFSTHLVERLKSKNPRQIEKAGKLLAINATLKDLSQNREGLVLETALNTSGAARPGLEVLSGFTLPQAQKMLTRVKAMHSVVIQDGNISGFGSAQGFYDRGIVFGYAFANPREKGDNSDPGLILSLRLGNKMGRKLRSLGNAVTAEDIRKHIQEKVKSLKEAYSIQ
ncbi:hypothetical protein C5B42_01665 [Candidatus Cerribacteria bacterium 'Amazon FNV 2010 28 9']|uniref:Uncharacterized protein n=1 Tax=Candidatus Cerribacteria bacterium 'Amazon FNV 2010 28 9' TaxID=2081795 RepID=A0A317JUP9_9BACT|nr:MAG: hypothetical protein C5B42_01665 [Candidatus Cerribacteria bacterium 'Amazon FNV 2010 28 9']